MKKRLKWLPLFSANFAGILNDNLLKTLIGFVCVLWIGPESKATLVSAAAALLVVPYIFLSPWAGKLAKEHPKAVIIKWAKLAEIPIMVIASLGFILNSITIVLIAMLLMGAQSCIYSPSKYGIIRDIGGVRGISFGTGAMEMLTFIAILSGTFLAGYISDLGSKYSANTSLIVICASFIALALVGWLTSMGIKVQESEPEDATKDTLNPFLFPFKWFKWSKGISGLNYTVLGLAMFWLIASMVQMNLYIYGEKFLKLSNTATGTIMALVALGIGTGCYVAGVISNHQINTKLVPIGGAGMAFSMLLVLVLQPGVILFTVLIIFFAFFAGLFKIPLNAFIQDKVKGRELGPVIAYNNQMEFFAILLSAALFSLVVKIFDARMVFLSVLMITILTTIIVYIKLPGAGRREQL